MARILNLSSLQPFQAVNLLSDPGHIAGPIQIDNAARLRINWTLGNGKTAHNILHFQYNGTPALSVTLADTIKLGLIAGGPWTAFAAHLAPTAALQSVTLTDIRQPGLPEFTSVAAATPGASTGTALPDEASIVVTLRTANRGPSGRGRFYLPGLATTALASGNVIASAVMTAIANWANNNVRGTINANLGPMCLGLPARAGYTSPITGRVFPARTDSTPPVTSCEVRDNHWDSQRRRGLR